MEKTLNQNEIDALFKSARKRSTPAPESSSSVQVYSFARAGQINEEQMRAISLLNDMFARNLMHNLGVWLRTRLHVNLVSAEQMPFSEFTLRLPDLAYVGSVRLEPLSALSVLHLDLGLAPAIIDRLLGGEGRPGPMRELTDIEESILTGVVESICRELSSAWQPVGLSFHFERRQMQTQVARVMPVTEKTLCLSFEIRIGEASGVLNLAFPAVVSNTILRRLTGAGIRRRGHAAEARERMLARAAGIRFGASLLLPRVRIEGRRLSDLEPGQILMLDLASNSEAELRIGGIPIYGARPVSRGDYRAAHLTSIRSMQQ